MPNRIIKDSINESLGLSKCSFFASDLYKRLITYADDYGRFNADSTIMLARLYPRELDSITEQDLIEALIELCGVGKIAFYTSNARKNVYGCFPNWSEHQRIRESKSKCPDPDDTDVNDWYLQRFVPLDLKIEIIERDGFKCRECGKFITTDKDARRLAKHGNGMYHIDHLVPVNQGGRASYENLRLLCPTCNLKRKKKFTFSEILRFSDNSPRVAASCRELPPESNPIQSESNPNPKEIYTRTTDVRHKYGEYKNVLLSDDDLEKLKKQFPNDWESRIEALSYYIKSKGDKYKDHLATIRNWARKEQAKEQPQQSLYSPEDSLDDLF